MTIAQDDLLARYLEGRLTAEEQKAIRPKVGFVEAFKTTDTGRPRDAVDLVGFASTIRDAAEWKGIYDAAKAVERGDATLEQMAQLEQWARANERDLTIGGHVARILAAAPAFMQEMFVGGGVASKVGRKVAKEAVEDAVEAAGQRGIAKGLMRAGKDGAAIAATNEVLTAGSGVRASAYQRMFSSMAPEITEDEAGELAVLFHSTGRNFVSVLPAAIIDRLVEPISERSGAALAGPASKIRGAMASVMGSWIKRNPDKGVEGFRRLIERAGWNGVVEEWLEERFGGALRAGAGLALPEDFGGVEEIFPGWEQLVAEGLAFGVMGGVARGAEALLQQIERGSDFESPENLEESRARPSGGLPIPTTETPSLGDAAGEIQPTNQAGREGGTAAEPGEGPQTLPAVDIDGPPTLNEVEGDSGDTLPSDPVADEGRTDGGRMANTQVEPPGSDTSPPQPAQESAEAPEPSRSVQSRPNPSESVPSDPAGFELTSPAAEFDAFWGEEASGPSSQGGEVRGGGSRTGREPAPRAPESGSGAREPEVRTARDPLTEKGSLPVTGQIGELLTGRLPAPEKPLPGKPVNTPQIMHALARVLEAGGLADPRVSQSGKRGMPGNAGGVFNFRTEVTRIRTANSIAVASHEVGHALDKALFGWKQGENPGSHSLPEPILRELRPLDYDKKKRRPHEGWAEFFRLYLMEPDAAKQVAPKTWEFVEKKLQADAPKVYRHLAIVRDLAQRWQGQGSVARGRSMIVDPASPGQRVKKALGGLRDIFTSQAWIEILDPFRKMSAIVEARRGKPLPVTEDPYALGTAFRMTHSARVAYMVETGMLDLAGNVVGEPLSKVRDLAGEGREVRENLTLYLYAKRSLALWDATREVEVNGQVKEVPAPRNPGITRDDAIQILHELGSPSFERAAQLVYEWNDGVLDYAAQASPTMALAVAQIRKTDPGFYIPLQREFDLLDRRARKRLGGGSVQTGNVSGRLKGSGRRIKDPFQAMIAQAEKLVLRAHQRIVLDASIKLGQREEGLGNFVREVPLEQVPAHTAEMGELFDRLQRAVKKAGGKIEFDGIENHDLADVFGEMVTFFGPAQTPKAGEHPVIPVVQEGNLHWWEVDAQVYKALTGMDVFRLSKFVDMTLGIPARMFRAGTTGLRASFGLVTNTARDMPTLYMNTRSTDNGAMLFMGWMRHMKGAFTASVGGKRSEWYDAFLRLGGQMAQPLGEDIAHTRRAARNLFAGKTARVINPRNWFDLYRDLVQFPESVPRTVDLEAVAKQVGWEPGMPMTLGQSIEMIRAVKQVTVDFTAAGEIAGTLNRVIPFFNVAFQAPRATIRAFRRDPMRWSIRAGIIASATLALWWRYRDEEWYEEMDPRERALYWHFEFGDEILRIPRPQDIGMLGAIPEMFADAWYREDPKGATEYFETMFGASKEAFDVTLHPMNGVIVPPWLPVPASVAAEQLHNRNFFWDSPIVSRSLERKPKREQFDEWTSLAAIKVGSVFGRSPKRIDHIVQGFLGGVGRDALSAMGLGAEGVEREFQPAEIPLLGRLFMRDQGLSRPKVIDRVYDLRNELELQQASDRHEETDAEAEARRQILDATRAISALGWVRSQTRGNEERAAMNRERIIIARAALGFYEAGKVDREWFAERRRAYEKAREEMRER